MTKPPRYAVLYTWPPGAEPAVHYTRPRTDTRLAREVLTLQRKARRGEWEKTYTISTKPEHTS